MSRLESTFTTSSFGRLNIPSSGILSWPSEELLSRFFEVYGGLSWHSEELLSRFFEVYGGLSWHLEELLSRFFEVYGGLSWHSEELLSRFFEVYDGLSVLLDLQKILIGTTGSGCHLFFLRDLLLFPKTDSAVTLTLRVS